jgi:hypothetical protein
VPLACHAPGCSLFPPPTLLPSHPGFHPVSSQAAFPGKPGKSPENEYSSAFPTLISETAWKLFQAVSVVEATAPRVTCPVVWCSSTRAEGYNRCQKLKLRDKECCRSLHRNTFHLWAGVDSPSPNDTYCRQFRHKQRMTQRSVPVGIALPPSFIPYMASQGPVVADPEVRPCTIFSCS